MQADDFQYSDGGRAEAGYKGKAGDCVTRSIAIASGLPYQDVYARLSTGVKSQRASKRSKNAVSARDGVYTTRKWFKDYMAELGAEWTPTMQIGQGCKVHLSADELPRGRLVVSVSRHYTTMIDGVIKDTHDPRRIDDAGTASRCVYGYWTFPPVEEN